MNILVTGANGFVGSNICMYLEQNTSYKIFRGTRNSINLYSFDSINQYIKDNNINTIIHCAIEGGKRTIVDSESIVYNNILMAQNLLACKIDGLFINIASGAEFDRSKNLFDSKENEIYLNSPKDYYGISKNIISKLINNLYNGINIRLFGCFYYNESPNRMIASNLSKYIKKENLIIHQDRYMDFIYIKDLFLILNHILKFNIVGCDINAVYLKKYKLSDIVSVINSLDNFKVPVIIQEKSIGLSYCGNGSKLNSMNLNLYGLEVGISECYQSML